MYRYFLWAAIGFISGSILYSYHIPKIFKNIDITKVSRDGNPGTSNAFKYAGIKVGIMCLALDLAKGFLPVMLAFLRLDAKNILFTLIVVSPVLGHATAFLYPHIGGGKAIAVSFGVLIALIPHSYIVLLLAAAYIFFSTVYKINPHEKRTVVTFLLFAAASIIDGLYKKNSVWGLSAAMISVIVIAKNRHDALSGDSAESEVPESPDTSPEEVPILAYAENAAAVSDSDDRRGCENN